VEEAYWGTPARAFEYYGHANCILPVESWPYFAFRRRELQSRAPRRKLPAAAMADVRARLREGPVTVGDLGGSRNGKAGWWNWSDEKRAIEWLSYRGEVVCVTRRGWNRVYDLPERAIPAEALAHDPSDEECYAWLVREGMRAMGVGTRRDIADYFRLTGKVFGCPANCNKLLDGAIEGAIEAGDVTPVVVEGWREPAYADAAALRRKKTGVARTTLLSPFDSLVWERRRAEELFGFAFTLEAYKPKEQRVRGYFTMPLLAGGTIAGWVDPAREGTTLVVRAGEVFGEAAVEPMAAALLEAATWVGCDDVRVEGMRPRKVMAAVRSLLR
jgi:uncharacterized protein YcaQ